MRKLLATALVTALALFIFTACGGNRDDNNVGESTTATPAQTPTANAPEQTPIGSGNQPQPGADSAQIAGVHPELGPYVRFGDNPVMHFFEHTTLLSFNDRDLTSEDLAPVRYFVYLERFSARNNNITDLSFLEGLTNLTDLELSGNQITDLTPLAGLTNLYTLHLMRTEVTDWSPVAHVPNVIGRPVNWDITVVIDTRSEAERSLERRGLTTDMTELILERDYTDADLGFLAYMTNLRYVEFTRTARMISDASVFANIPYLETLILGENRITDWTPLAHVPNVYGRPDGWEEEAALAAFLAELGDRPSYVQMGPLLVSTTAQQLSFRAAGIVLTDDEFESLRYFLGIRILSFAPGQNLTNLDFLSGFNFRGITQLDLQNQGTLVCIAGIAYLTNLQMVWLGENQIVDASPFAELYNINFLLLENNLITDVSPFANLTYLMPMSPAGGGRLNLYGNPITDWSPLAHFRFVGGRPSDWNQ